MCQEPDVTSSEDNLIWRACWPSQIEAIRNKDPSDIVEPTSEMTGNAQLENIPVLRFTQDREIAKTFALREGNVLIEINLSNLADDEWQLWEPTGDIHVSFNAVVREVNLDAEGT